MIAAMVAVAAELAAWWLIRPPRYHGRHEAPHETPKAVAS